MNNPVYIYIYIYIYIQRQRERERDKYIQGDQQVSVHLTMTVQKTRTNTVFQTVSITYHDNVVRVRYNRWRQCESSVPLALEGVGDTLNINCNFLYCNHQVHREFLIILYIYRPETSDVAGGCGRLGRIKTKAVTYQKLRNLTIIRIELNRIENHSPSLLSLVMIYM